MDPGILHPRETDEGPGVVFIDLMTILVEDRRVEVGYSAQILDADVVDSSGIGVSEDGAAPELLVQGIGQRCIDGNQVVRGVDCRNHAVGVHVLLPGPPGVGRPVHADGMNPGSRARAVNDDRIAYRKPGDAVHMKTVGANRHVIVRDTVCGPGQRGKVVAAVPVETSRQGTLNLHDSVHEGMVGVIASVSPRGLQYGAELTRACGIRAHTAEHDAGRGDPDLAVDGIQAGLQEDRTAEAVRIERQLRDLVDGGLDHGARVRAFGQGFHDHLDRHIRRPLRARKRYDAALVADIGKIGDDVSLGIGNVGQVAVGAGKDQTTRREEPAILEQFQTGPGPTGCGLPLDLPARAPIVPADRCEHRLISVQTCHRGRTPPAGRCVTEHFVAARTRRRSSNAYSFTNISPGRARSPGSSRCQS
jgi:hypothetical protein